MKNKKISVVENLRKILRGSDSPLIEGVLRAFISDELTQRVEKMKNERMYGKLQTKLPPQRDKTPGMTQQDPIYDEWFEQTRDGQATYDAFVFYAKRANWYLLPKNRKIKLILFSEAQVLEGSGYATCYLERAGTSWRTGNIHLWCNSWYRKHGYIALPRKRFSTPSPKQPLKEYEGAVDIPAWA